MKKAISFLSLLLMAIIAFAEPHFVSLSNKGGKTTVIFTLTSGDKDSKNGLGIENIMLEYVTMVKLIKPNTWMPNLEIQQQLS